MFAACGTPLVAITNTKVIFTGFQGWPATIWSSATRRCGTTTSTRTWQPRPLVTKGQVLAPGQQVGTVGDTGNASGCHLHFELWKRPGWYRGGKAIDPLPTLLAWDPAF